MPHRSLRLALSLAFAVTAACRAKEAPPDTAAEPIGPVVEGMTDVRQAPLAAAPAAAPPAGESWNVAQIDWQPYEAGLVRAKAQNKPVCLVLYTGWCPHCRNYSHVFDDPKVVERARDFVMIRANADEEPAIAGKFKPDGGYVPRTFFLSPDGTLDPEIHAPRPKFLYFFDEHDPRPLLAGMDTARHKLAR
jgi:thiol:disulfide interchange protein